MHKHTAAAPVPTRKVVDAFTRTLHALMALSFGLAYITGEADGWRWVHVTMGYTLGAAFLLRVVWGVWGPRRVALRGLWGRLSGASRLPELVRHLDAPALLKLLLPLSMVAVLVAMLPVVASGYATYFRLWGEWMEDIHETIANTMLLAVGVHVTVVLILRAVNARGLRPMWTGSVAGQGPDLVRHNLVPLAMAQCCLVASFWAWQTHQYTVDPQFMHQPKWLHPEGGYDEDD